jgi:hypothetical protein
MGAIADERIQAPGYAGSATTAEDYIRESLLDPKAYLVPGYEVTSHHMPAYVHLEEGDINALVLTTPDVKVIWERYRQWLLNYKARKGEAT